MNSNKSIKRWLASALSVVMMLSNISVTQGKFTDKLSVSDYQTDQEQVTEVATDVQEQSTDDVTDETTDETTDELTDADSDFVWEWDSDHVWDFDFDDDPWVMEVLSDAPELGWYVTYLEQYDRRSNLADLDWGESVGGFGVQWSGSTTNMAANQASEQLLVQRGAVDFGWTLMGGTWRNGSNQGQPNDIQPGSTPVRTIHASGLPTGAVAVRVWASETGNGQPRPTFSSALNHHNITIGGQAADHVVNEATAGGRATVGNYVWFYWADAPGGELVFTVHWPSAAGVYPGRARIAAIDVFGGELEPMNPAHAPANLSATDNEDAQTTLSWEAVAMATRHEFSHRRQGETIWSAWQPTDGNNNHVVTGLTNGTTYEFQVRGHDGTVASATSATVTATPSALPVLALRGAGTSHSFGEAIQGHGADAFTPLAMTLANTGTANATNVAATLTTGGVSFELTGVTGWTYLAPDTTVSFTVAPRVGLPAGLHNGVVTITADNDNLADITLNVSFHVLPQPMNAAWGERAYHFNFANLPTDGTQTAAGAIGSVPTNPISARHPSIRTVASHARQQNFELLIGIGTNANNGFRSNGTAPHNFIDPNGTGRLLGASHTLQAPIRVELDVLSAVTHGSSDMTLYFGDQSARFPVIGSPQSPTTVVVEFAHGEGLLRTGAFNWGGNEATDRIGRVGLQAVRIYEGAFEGPWISYPTGFAFDFDNLPYDYTATNVASQSVRITNVGSASTTLTPTVGEGFELMPAILSNLAPGQSVDIVIRPVLGLGSGLHQTHLSIAGSGANTLIIPVSVQVDNPLRFPEGIPLFATGAGVSSPTQFPNNLTEEVMWAHDFRRVSFVEGSPIIRFNGQSRDTDTNLAIPFMLNNLLWVPLPAAQAALPGVNLSLSGDYLTASMGEQTYHGVVLVATAADHGADAVFVPIQTIANRLNHGNLGFDTASNTLIVTTGQTVEQGNVLYNNINNRHEAWYGSPNSLQIATNFVYMQRSNGGWPRGIGQLNALPHQQDIGGMAVEVVQNIALGVNSADSYFGRGITTNETRFLLRMYEATGIERFREAGLRGFDTIIRTQDGLGGWPYQISGGSYHRALSISDNSINNILWFMMDIETQGILVDTLGEERVNQASNALAQGMSWLLNTQVRSAGFADGVARLTAWPMAVYQSGVESFPLQPGATLGVPGQPAWQREFEPPSINGNESVDILRFLMSIPNPSQAVQEAIHAGVYFFNYIRIDGYRLNHNTGLHPQLGRNIVPEVGARPLWPRFIHLETFEPLFFDRTGPFANTVSPHQQVSITAFEAAHGEWLGYHTGFVSANATSAGTDASAVRAGTLRNLYRDETGVLSTDPSGTFDLPASFHNLSFERRAGFNYINHFAESLPSEYAQWLQREGLRNPNSPEGGSEPPASGSEGGMGVSGFVRPIMTTPVTLRFDLGDSPLANSQTVYTVQLQAGHSFRTMFGTGIANRVPNPQREGYLFRGWFIQGTDRRLTLNTVIQEDTTVIARFSPRHR